ncbi:Disease resistance protein (CC-NBS-LRR class) family [Euphorbia peplus]|nr:Disease resistance protein (CC-NBS-LRR class) family [Euphorbia peplus]
MSVVGLETLMNEAWDLLMDETTESIAICGPGGIGKTTLMKQLYNKLLGTHHFETLIWVTVSSNSKPVKIQYEISKSIGLFDSKWVHSSFVEKAKLVNCALSEKKFVLFLDDVWGQIDLLELGVPVQKLIFTTRYVAVAYSMNVHSTLGMDVLSMEDSLQLFRNKFGDDDIFRDMRVSELPEIFVTKCCSLPILLCTVARAMASRKTHTEWLDALLKIERLEGTDTQLLQFCFDSLPNHRVRRCLVYFSLFPEDFAIHKNDLIDIWICEHLLDEYDTENTTLDLGYSAIHTLIGAGLMEEEDDDRVKLLDTIRDFALSMAAECNMFVGANLLQASLEKLVDDVGWPSTMRSFQQKLASTTPHDLFFTFLVDHNPFIMIKPKSSSRTVNQLSYNLLTALDLSYSGVEKVPREISVLVSLQYLNLSNTWIDRLPVELNMLTKLKCLNLEYNDQLRIIPRKLMLGLSSLQVLKIFRCGYSVEVLADNILSVRDMDIEPLLCMQHLKVLSITITCVFALHKFFNSPNLSSCTQSLSLEIFWGSELLDISPVLTMKHLLTLEIHQAEVLKELNFNHLVESKLPSQQNFGRLRKITLRQCSNLRELTWVALAPNLNVLRVENCEEMEEIISIAQLRSSTKGGEIVEPFAKLEILALECLPKLKSIYWKPLPFRHLKKIEILDCSLLKKLPLNSDSYKELVIEGEEDWWNNVEWEDDTTQIAFVSCFRQLV